MDLDCGSVTVLLKLDISCDCLSTIAFSSSVSDLRLCVSAWLFSTSSSNFSCRVSKACCRSAMVPVAAGVGSSAVISHTPLSVGLNYLSFSEAFRFFFFCFLLRYGTVFFLQVYFVFYIFFFSILRPSTFFNLPYGCRLLLVSGCS